MQGSRTGKECAGSDEKEEALERCHVARSQDDFLPLNSSS